jgi:tetratricopeptide (TPR) repeat protein
MTIDVCPFITESQNMKPCPGCIIMASEARIKGHEAVISNCLKGIKEEIDAAINSGKQNIVVPIGLLKLKRITAFDEEPKLDILNKKRVLEVLYILEELLAPLGKTETVQYDLDIGDVLFNVGDYDKALKRYNELVKKQPENKRVWNNIGVTMVRQGLVKEALTYYDKALELDPTFGRAWFNKGKALFKLGMKKKALDCFRKATKYSPENKSAWNNLGVTLRQLKRFKESIKCYDKALKIHSEYPWAWHNKGVALMELKSYKDAMKCFDKALQIDPNYEPANESKRELMRKLM